MDATDTKNPNDKVLCPSYTCSSGARLIGIVRADGSVAFLGRPLEIDRTFADIAREGRAPETRFRFAGACAQRACANWQGCGCGIAAGLPASPEPTGDLPECGIRPHCRWFLDRGPAACAACPEIVRGSDDRT